MPDMTGFDLAEELLRIRPNLPVILCSGFNEKTDVEKITYMDDSVKVILKTTPLYANKIKNKVKKMNEEFEKNH
jgi:CheY-like chemotaxis protein